MRVPVSRLRGHGRFANMTRSHWVADGGLLDNRPLAPLLATVLCRRPPGRSGGCWRSSCPMAAAAPAPPPRPSLVTLEEPLTMASALKTDLDAQLSQSIAGDLELIRAHNDQLNAHQDLRRSLADLGSRLRGDDQQPATAQPPSDRLITGQMLRTSRASRAVA